MAWSLLTLLSLLLFAAPAAALVVPCQPLPQVKVTVAAQDYEACQHALATGAPCTVATTIKNKSTTPIQVGMARLYQFGGSDPDLPNVRKATQTPVGKGRVATIPAGSSMTFTDPITFSPGSVYACQTTKVYTDNGSCGDADQRRQWPLGEATDCMLSSDYPVRSPIYTARLNCMSYLWGKTGGTCGKGPDCWYHDQLFFEDPGQTLKDAWRELNCDDRYPAIDTRSLGTIHDGPSGYRLWRQ